MRFPGFADEPELLVRMSSTKSSVNGVPNERFSFVCSMRIEVGEVLELHLALAPAVCPASGSLITSVNPEGSSLNIAIVLKHEFKFV